MFDASVLGGVGWCGVGWCGVVWWVGGVVWCGGVWCGWVVWWVTSSYPVRGTS